MRVGGGAGGEWVCDTFFFLTYETMVPYYKIFNIEEKTPSTHYATTSDVL